MNWRSGGELWKRLERRYHEQRQSEWNASGKCQYAISQLPQVTEFKCMGSTLQSDGDMSTEVNKGHSVDGKTSGVALQTFW